MATAFTKVISGNWKALATSLKETKKTKKAEEPLWFDVSERDLKRSEVESVQSNVTVATSTIIASLFTKADSANPVVGRYLALDCEMVGVGPNGIQNALARVSLVNWHGQVVLDTFVRPVERVTDFRTAVSGVRPGDLRDAPGLAQVQRQVSDLLDSNQIILIGHSLSNDFAVLLLNHPRRMIRDTSKYRPFRQLSRGKTPSLKRLALDVLGLRIQEGEHDSVDDARVAMLLYQSCKDEWENYLFRNEGRLYKQQRREKKQQRQEKCESC